MDKNKQKDDEYTIRFLIISKSFDLAKQVIGGCVLIVLAYIGYLAIDALAGKTTITNIVLKYLTAQESDYGIPWISVILFALWAILERKLRKRKTEVFQKRIKILEKKIDHNRTSSGLSPSGETNPEDKNL